MSQERDHEAIALVLRAASFAAFKHRSQRRKNADATPYVNHPLALATILAVEGGVSDPIVLAAALLRDTVEDTDTSVSEIEANFGTAVAGIVAEVTDDKSLPKKERKRLQVAKAHTKSAGAKLVKLADKLSNLRDIQSDPPATWNRKRREDYLEWAKQVVTGLRGTNARIEAAVNQVFESGLGLKGIPDRTPRSTQT